MRYLLLRSRGKPSLSDESEKQLLKSLVVQYVHGNVCVQWMLFFTCSFMREANNNYWQDTPVSVDHTHCCACSGVGSFLIELVLCKISARCVERPRGADHTGLAQSLVTNNGHNLASPILSTKRSNS